MNVLLMSSRQKNKPVKKPERSRQPVDPFLAAFLTGLIFDPEDGGIAFLQNVG
jgi:hypothetical protein